MAVINFYTRRECPPRTEALGQLEYLLQQAEEVKARDSLARLAGRFSARSTKRLRELKTEWAKIRSSAPELGNDDTDVEALRIPFIAIMAKAGLV